jgi:hypothetical protein
MTTQNYLMISNATNVVENVCAWDGNTETWTTPAGMLMLVQSTTPAMVWTAVTVDNKITDWSLTSVTGTAGIGFTWNGSVCTTNEPKPTIPTV